LSTIKEAFQKLKSSSVGATEFIVRDRNTIDEYLFEVNTVYSNKESKKLFDHVDFIFIDGDANMLPWMKATKKFGILFKMSKKTNKCMFAGGFGFGLLIYYCATNYEDLRVINGNGRGGPLEDINDIPLDTIRGLRRNEVFLDNTTGDYYIFNKEAEQWNPHGNTGLHHSRTAETSGSIGDFMKKTKVYRPGSIKELMDLYKSKLTEWKCTIKKPYIQHWSVLDLPPEFLVSCKNAWDSHPVNITNIVSVGKNYTTIAESDKGPVIIEHKNTLGVQFHIDKKYTESLKVVHNFVQKKLTEIQSTERLYFTIEEADFMERNAHFENQKQTNTDHLSAIAKSALNVANSANQGSEYTVDFKHSGLNYSKRRAIVVVTNNAIRDTTIRPSTTTSGSKSFRHNSSVSQFVRLRTPQTASTSNIRADSANIISRNPSQFSIPSTYFLSGEDPVESKMLSGQRSTGSLLSRPTSIQTKSRIIDIKQTSNSSRNSNVPSLDKWQINSAFQKSLIEETLTSGSKSKREIRQMLHPTLSEQYLPKDERFLPGFKALNTLFSDKSKVIKLKMHEKKPYSRFNEFSKMPSDFEKPVIRNASPYVSEEEMRRCEEKKSKEKWIAEKDFWTVTGNATRPNFIENYVSKDPSIPPMLHQFRNEEREKWVGPNFKI